MKEEGRGGAATEYEELIRYLGGLLGEGGRGLVRWGERWRMKDTGHHHY